MRIILTALLSLFLITPTFAFEPSPDETFITIIRWCKNDKDYNDILKDVKKGDESAKRIKCYCDAFSNLTEDEIITSYLLAVGEGIPAYNLLNPMSKAMECSNRIK